MGDVLNVTNMGQMFRQVRYFNQSIKSWEIDTSILISGWSLFLTYDTSSPYYNDANYKTINSQDDFDNYFFHAFEATDDNIQNAVNAWILDENAAITSYGSIETWITTNVTNMSELFKNKTTFNQNISNWDVSACDRYDHMF